MITTNPTPLSPERAEPRPLPVCRLCGSDPVGTSWDRNDEGEFCWVDCFCGASGARCRDENAAGESWRALMAARPAEDALRVEIGRLRSIIGAGEAAAYEESLAAEFRALRERAASEIEKASNEGWHAPLVQHVTDDWAESAARIAAEEIRNG